MKICQQTHGGQCDRALSQQLLRVLVATKQALMLDQCILYFAVAGQLTLVEHAIAFGGFAFGSEKVANAVLGHQPRGFLRD